jgi:hypothetical protein
MWGTARWLTLAGVVLTVACLIDWVVDLRQDTPRALREGMLVTQAGLWVLSALVLVLVPVLRRLSNNRLALFVEEKIPDLDHRLISAVQLNKPRADTRGMSPALIGVVTQEAEIRARALHFPRLADHRRLGWAAAVLAPLGIVAGLCFALWPDTMLALLARQLLDDCDIPRSVHLESRDGDHVGLAGEELVLIFRASGANLSEDVQGEVRIDPQGQPSMSLPLVFKEESGDGVMLFETHVPPSIVDYSYKAWLRDGRLRHPYRVHIEAHPAIEEQQAWIRMPDWCGRRPNGQPYELERPRGDIFALPGTSARVAIRTQKSVRQAIVEILTPVPDASPTYGLPLERVSRQREMVLDEEGTRAETLFDLRPDESGYRIKLVDQYGFTNVDPPRRDIRFQPDEPPRVTLLPEQFPSSENEGGAAEDYEVGGVPVPLGGNIRIGYTCSTPFGLGRADQKPRRTPRLQYRVNEGPWSPLLLKEVGSTEKIGPFDPRTGAFARSKLLDEVEYHAIPSTDPDKFMGRLEGGGRFDFKTRAIRGLKVGDFIEFYLEVFDQNPDPNRAPGLSETRVKKVVTPGELESWVQQTLQEESYIRQIEGRQRGIFTASIETPLDEPPEPLPGVARFPPSKPLPPGPSTFVRSWQLLGPFPNPEERGRDTAYPPETDSVFLGREYDGLKGKIRWQAYESDTDTIDLEKYFKHSEAGVAYALCWVRAKQVRQAVLATGSDDGIKVWLNRKVVLERRIHREAIPGDDRTPVDLAADWNEVLVKVDNRTGSWAFILEFRDPATGRVLQGVEYRATPP